VAYLVSALLLLNAVFNVVTWPTFLKRVGADPRARDAEGRATRFLTVHRVLVAIAMVLAAASAIVGVYVAVVAVALGRV
jgi:ABC-type microcin C transport system permease subunit YejE